MLKPRRRTAIFTGALLALTLGAVVLTPGGAGALPDEVPGWDWVLHAGGLAAERVEAIEFPQAIGRQLAAAPADLPDPVVETTEHAIELPGESPELEIIEAATEVPADPAPEPDPEPRPWDMNRGPNWTDRVLLTFDDCLSSADQFREVIDHVAASNIGLMLFLTGDCVSMHNAQGFDIVGYARERGQWVANHTRSHADLTKLGPEAIIGQVTGEPVSNLVRAPYGQVSPSVHNVLASVERWHVHWTLDTNDWQGRGAQEIAEFVVAHADPGANVLMHLQHQGFRVEVIEHIRIGLAQRGLELCRAWPEPTGTWVPDNIC